MVSIAEVNSERQLTGMGFCWVLKKFKSSYFSNTTESIYLKL
jgi:hypothetical protein